MAIWAWLLSILLGLAFLTAILLLLFRVRYRFTWQGELDREGLSGTHEGSFRLEFGLPGFRRSFTIPIPSRDDTSGESAAEPDAGSARRPPETGRAFTTENFRPSGPPSRPVVHHFRPAGERAAPESPPSEEDAVAPDSAAESPDAAGSGTSKRSSRKADRASRARRALFRFATDPQVWSAAWRYGRRSLRAFFRVFGLRVQAAVGHPDPALLGRLAGRWYSARPFLPLGSAVLHFRFQDRTPTARVHAEGGFSAFSVVLFVVRLVVTFPWFRMARRAWRAWRHPELDGWRAWVYQRTQPAA